MPWSGPSAGRTSRRAGRPRWAVAALVLLTLPWFGATAAATLVHSDTLVPHAAGRIVAHLTATDDTFDGFVDDLAEQLGTLAPAEVEAAGGPARTRAALRAAVDGGALTGLATAIGEALGRGMLDGSDPNGHLAVTGADAAASAIDDLGAAVGPPLESALREHREAVTAPVDVGDPEQLLDPVVDADGAPSDGTAARQTASRSEQGRWRGLRGASVPLTAAAFTLGVVLMLAARAVRPARWLGVGAVVAWLLVAGFADLSAGRGALAAMFLAPVLWACWPAAVVVACGTWLFSRPDTTGPISAG